MHYGLYCKNKTCERLAFRLRPGLRPDDIGNKPLTMSYFVGMNPLDPIHCPHCQYIFKAEDFRVEELCALL